MKHHDSPGWPFGPRVGVSGLDTVERNRGLLGTHSCAEKPLGEPTFLQSDYMVV